MRINRVNSKISFGMFERETARRMFDGTKNNVQKENEIKNLIIRAAKNKDFDITEKDGTYSISWVTKNDKLPTNPECTYTSSNPKDVVVAAERYQNELYGKYSTWWPRSLYDTFADVLTRSN